MTLQGSTWRPAIIHLSGKGRNFIKGWNDLVGIKMFFRKAWQWIVWGGLSVWGGLTVWGALTL